jgi:hypothetical protein
MPRAEQLRPTSIEQGDEVFAARIKFAERGNEMSDYA